MEKIGILTRVSSKVQESDGTSLDVQKNLGLKVSKNLGFKPIIFNEGSQSSFNVEINERLQLVELLEEIQKKSGGIRKVWVFNTDRLGRYSKSWYTILKVFLDYSVELYVGESSKPYDFNNPNDKLSIGILSLVSQYDNELRRLRSVMGKRNSLRSGNTFVGGTIPFGYSLKGKMLISNEGESKVVKRMYEMYRDGKSSTEIKLFLDTKTEYEPKRSKDGWNLGTIQKMLGNSLYNGVQIWEWKEKIGGEYKIVETIKIKTPKIISTKLWSEVQLKLQQNHKHKNYESSHNSLLKGLLYCKSCGVKISSSERKPYPLYQCRSVEYKWKNSSKWGEKHHNCTLKRSLRIEETDKKVLNHIISIIKDSKKVREEFKIKNLSSKFNEVENIKKELSRRNKELNNKKKYLRTLEEEVIDLEFQIITNQIQKSKGKKISKKISDLIDTVEGEIKVKERELSVFSNSDQWIDWLNQMYLEIDTVESMKLEKQQTFLKEYIEKILVEYVSKSESHQFTFEFKYPIVEDEIMIEGLKDGKRVYQIKEGSKTSTIKLPINDNINRLTKNDRVKLDRMITKLRVEQSLSLSKVSDLLNKNGFRTVTNKNWDKTKLSSYIKHMKVEVGK
jgi:site-specific DNA recombinase